VQTAFDTQREERTGVRAPERSGFRIDGAQGFCRRRSAGFITYGNASQGKMVSGSAGAGGSNHLASEIMGHNLLVLSFYRWILKTFA
jgi:hypothetical protein